MPYDAQTDSFTCPAGKRLTCTGTRHSKSKSGYESEISVYSCSDCWECPLKHHCTKSKTSRKIYRSKQFWALREQAHERIVSEKGVLLRLNRSIQSEGTFGILKQDGGFRRFLRRGGEHVYTEVLLYAFAFNMAKLHAKIQNHLIGVMIHKLTAS